MPSDATRSAVVPLRPTAPRRAHELAFLPAAFEVVETPASPTARFAGLAIVGMLALAVVWACLGRVDIIANATGRLVPEGRVKRIQPFETGVVTAIHVADGQHVAAGQILLELDPTGNQAERDKAAREELQAELDIARLRALLASETSPFLAPAGSDPAAAATEAAEMQSDRDEQEAKLADLDHQLASKQAEQAEADATVARIDATLPMLIAHERIREATVRHGYGNDLDLLDAQRQVVDQQRQRVVEQAKREQAVEDVAALRRHRAEAIAEFRSRTLADLAKAETDAAESGDEEIKAARRTALETLRAPVAGTVQQLDVHTLGGVVTPAEHLLEIVPEDARLEIEAMLANRDVGFVHAGQPVEIKVEAFDFTRYGLLHGTVVGLSRDAVDDEMPSAEDDGTGSRAGANRWPRRDGQAAYVAHVSVQETSVATPQGKLSLQAGMRVTAEIRTGRRRLISYLLSPLARHVEEGMRER